MKKYPIEITVEQTMRVALSFDATEDEIARLKNGDNPFQKQFDEEFEKCCMDPARKAQSRILQSRTRTEIQL